MAHSMFPHTVTLYTTLTETDPETLEDTEHQHITILRGVLLDASKAANVNKSGLEGADAANLYIPFDVEAVDGLTGGEKVYADPVAFLNADDKSGLWTLSDGGNTVFAKGEIVEPDRDVAFLELKYGNVYTVTKVDEKDFGGLAHWEVGGA